VLISHAKGLLKPQLVLSVRPVHHIVVAFDMAPTVNHDVLAGPQIKERARVVSFRDANLDGRSSVAKRLQEQREHIAMYWLAHPIRTVVRASVP
jgi:hypothetical protein